MRWRPFVAILLGLATGGAGLESQVVPASPPAGECLVCHDDAELLRSQASPGVDLAALRVSSEMIHASGHTGMECSECHTGFSRFPHRASAETATCGTSSCHSNDPHPDWEESVHSRIQEDTGIAAAECTACHGVHEVDPLEELRVEGGPAMLRMNQSCVSCHLDQSHPNDPHADTASCAGCHAPHATRAVDSADSWVAPLRQAETCGACHEQAADSARVDTHGLALLRQGRVDPLSWPPSPKDSIAPTCSDCHGAHPMAGPGSAEEQVLDGQGRVVSDEAFQLHMIERCSACHTKAADTYLYTYHGKATRLGSGVAASCAQCHGAHSVLPEDSAASTVHADNLVATCGDCHSEARPAFVLYTSHPDSHDREGDPVLYWTYVFMHALLIGTLGVFGLHTLLWWLRIWIDSRREGGSHA